MGSSASHLGNSAFLRTPHTRRGRSPSAPGGLQISLRATRASLAQRTSANEQRLEITHYATLIPLDLDPRRISKDQVEAAPIFEQIGELQFPVQETVPLAKSRTFFRRGKLAQSSSRFTEPSSSARSKLLLAPVCRANKFAVPPQRAATPPAMFLPESPTSPAGTHRAMAVALPLNRPEPQANTNSPWRASAADKPGLPAAGVIARSKISSR